MTKPLISKELQKASEKQAKEVEAKIREIVDREFDLKMRWKNVCYGYLITNKDKTS
jgi:hypothetical protein